MIAKLKQRKSNVNDSARHDEFLAMLPVICSCARHKFRLFNSDVRDDLVQEVVCNAFRAYRRLVELGKQDLAYPTALARFAVKQVRAGRRIGGNESPRDVMSPRAQCRVGFAVERLAEFSPAEQQWKEVLVEDKRATPADIAACRVDFAEWLKLLSKRERKIALSLAGGETTSGVAKKFGVTSARISQLRGWLRQSWERFQSETHAKQAQLAIP